MVGLFRNGHLAHLLVVLHRPSGYCPVIIVMHEGYGAVVCLPDGVHCDVSCGSSWNGCWLPSYELVALYGCWIWNGVWQLSNGVCGLRSIWGSTMSVHVVCYGVCLHLPVGVVCGRSLHSGVRIHLCSSLRVCPPAVNLMSSICWRWNVRPKLLTSRYGLYSSLSSSIVVVECDFLTIGGPVRSECRPAYLLICGRRPASECESICFCWRWVGVWWLMYLLDGVCGLPVGVDLPMSIHPVGGGVFNCIPSCCDSDGLCCRV